MLIYCICILLCFTKDCKVSKLCSNYVSFHNLMQALTVLLSLGQNGLFVQVAIS